MNQFQLLDTEAEHPNCDEDEDHNSNDLISTKNLDTIDTVIAAYNWSKECAHDNPGGNSPPTQ